MSEIITSVNLILAFILGSGIGWFREKEKKTAGMRTHILVCLGSALFMVLSAKMMALSAGADPGRLAAGVATGIGFIGAGCIVQTGSGVRGITTAASIWVTAAIGIAAGAGFYVEAVVSAILTIAALQVIRTFEAHYFKTKEE
ncbi:MAG: MgtC/SapB family protein [Candidatus Margulisbacteria bacterium]|nr:MgtC/SapB family protein [Candidatus Margulisiibacteriota bacterium]